ncbi:MAG: sodium:calcium antiporter [Candidatus Micrarchaeota archaeon]|nr:sodium:calcium antiporter [Candidatus Micrarchaeota archaeon]
MALVSLLFLLASLLVLIKSAEYAITYASRLARIFHISEFVVSFFFIAVMSCFPEATVSIVSALSGTPEFGLGTLIGSNVADLAMVFGVVALFSKNGITVKSEILKSNFFYLVLLLVPLILGFDGNISRIDGLILIICGGMFFATLLMQRKRFSRKFNHAESNKWAISLILLAASIAALIMGAYYTVKFSVSFASEVGVHPFLIALTMVAVGTCMPELVFSIRAVTSNHSELALGDILGNVIIDATILLGIVALIHPIDFNPTLIYVTGSMMFLAGALLIYFLRSGRMLTRQEGLYLLLFYIIYLIIEFSVNGIRLY